MSLFIPTERHIQILNEIGRWKIISLRELFNQTGANIMYSPFCRTLKKLEIEGLVKSHKGHRRKKYFSLSLDGGKFSNYSCPYAENKKELRHDVISSNVLRELLDYKNFKSGHIVVEDLDLIPDALIYAKKNEKEYSLAIEVELHQKSKKRLIDKYSRYGDSHIFNYCLYVTNKRAIYDFYKKTLTEMNEKVQEKIIILMDENLMEHQFDYLKVTLWFRGSNKSFDEIFS